MIPEQSMWDLWRTKKGLERVSLQVFRCSLSVLFQQSNINILTLKLLLSEGQTGEACEP
jgi:hypothetical protein